MRSAVVIAFCSVLLVPAVLKAQVPTEFVIYGEAGYRANNLAGVDPSSAIPRRSHWFLNPEIRFIFGDRSRASRLRPYLRANPAFATPSNPVENTLTGGVGVEIRPLIDRYHGPFRAPIWLRPMRFYTEYLHQGFWDGAKPNWSPRHDWLIGFDHWKEFGAVDSDRPDNPDRSWMELFFGAAWHDTDLFQDGYNSIRYGANVRAGFLADAGRYPVLPYVMVDLNGSSRQNYEFENRLVGGLGVRTQWQFGPRARIKLFAEQRWILAFLKNRPAAAFDVKHSDQVIGISFQYNRY
jgi:hypothetical protein